jgi:hypothetical protein
MYADCRTENSNSESRFDFSIKLPCLIKKINDAINVFSGYASAVLAETMHLAGQKRSARRAEIAAASPPPSLASEHPKVDKQQLIRQHVARFTRK